MIYTLDHASTTEQRELRYIIKNRYNEEKYIRRAMELVIQNGGLTYAQQRMVSLGEEAKKMLEPLENNEAKTALIGLVDYTMQRTK